MPPEQHPCGLRSFRRHDARDSTGNGLRCEGEAGPLWRLLMWLPALGMARPDRQAARRLHCSDAGAPRGTGGAGGKSIQKVVPIPTSLSKPI